jgi:hypothetical protein
MAPFAVRAEYAKQMSVTYRCRRPGLHPQRDLLVFNTRTGHPWPTNEKGNQ